MKKFKLRLTKVSLPWVAFVIFILVTLGILGTWWTSKHVDLEKREELLNQALLVGQAVNVHVVKSFTGTDADLNSPNYQRLAEQLSIILKTKSNCRFLYLLGRNPDGTVFFFLDTDEVDKAKPGEVYREASKDLKEIFDKGDALVEGPLPDNWGNWVSALVPVKDDETGKVIAVLGMDIDARIWKSELLAHAAWPLSLMMAVLVLMALGILVARHQAERSVRLSEARLRRAEFASKSGNWELHLNSSEIYASDGAMKIYGLSSSRIDYSDIKKMPLTEFRPMLDKALNELIEENKAYDVEFKIRTADNEEIKDIHSAAVFDAEKKVVFGIIQDITYRKQVEDALSESEQRYRLHFENSMEAFLLTSPDARVLSVNPATCQMFGRSGEEICNGGRDQIIDMTDPRVYEAMAERSRTGRFFGELTGLRRDGSKFPIELATTLFTDRDGNVRSSMIIQDISDRKRTEKRLAESEANARAIMESTDDVLVLLDKNGILIDCNEAHARYLNKTREELLGKSIFEDLPPDLAKSRREAVDLCISTGECIYREDTRFGRYIEYVVHPICSENKTVDKVAVFALDATKRKQDEQILQENEKRLQELNATKDKFFSIIAHDLKSPFNSIIGFSSLLTRHVNEGDIEGIRKYATIVQDSSQQALDLLMNLLEWSRSQIGRMVFTPEEADISALISQSVGVLIGSAQQKQISLHKQMPANLVAWVDKAMINAVLRNFISNAIKFTNPGGTVVISAEQTADELRISVVDNGVGISKESIDKLFRIEETHSTLGTQKEKGTGLGLLLCKEFVERHGGRIWVESEIGEGSNFSFSIPQKKGISAGT